MSEGESELLGGRSFERARRGVGNDPRGHELPAGSAQVAVTKIADHLAHGQGSFGDDVLAERVQP